MNKTPLIIVETIRFFIPFLIFFHPVAAITFSISLDAFDGQLFFNAGYPWYVYNTVDKLMDLWWYFFIVLYFRSSVLFPIAFTLFIFRLIGQVIGILQKNEKIYMAFPNILEWFFLNTLIIPTSPVLLRLVSALGFSLFLEWLIHSSNAHIVSRYIFRKEIVWKNNERGGRKRNRSR